MGVGKSMKIFMEGVQNSMNSTSTGGKILNTPMGPFAWNDNLQMWVNTNNGFSMPNISMQDMLAIGYDTLSGSGDSDDINNKNGTCTAVIPAIGPSAVSIYFEDTAELPTSTTTPTISCSPTIYLTDNNVGGVAVHQLLFQYTIDAGSTYTNFTPLPSANTSRTYILFAQGSSLGSTVKFNVYKADILSAWANPGTYSFTIKNGYNDSTIGAITIITRNTI